MKRFSYCRSLFCLLLCVLLLPLPLNQAQSEALPEDSPFAPYLSLFCSEHFSFISDEDGEIQCRYEIPLVRETLACSHEANDIILSKYRYYVFIEDGLHYIPDDEFTWYADPLIAEDYAVNSSIGSILTEYTWEANIYKDVLSIRFTRTNYNPGRLAFLFEPEYDVINIDLLTGEMLESVELLERIGVDEADLMAKIDFGMCDLLGEPPEPYPSELRDSTFYYNPYVEVLERGLYLSPEGMQVWVYLDTGSKYIYKYIMTMAY